MSETVSADRVAAGRAGLDGAGEAAAAGGATTVDAVCASMVGHATAPAIAAAARAADNAETFARVNRRRGAGGGGASTAVGSVCASAVLATKTTATLIARNPILFTCPLRRCARADLLKSSPIVPIESAVCNGFAPALLFFSSPGLTEPSVTIAPQES